MGIFKISYFLFFVLLGFSKFSTADQYPLRAEFVSAKLPQPLHGSAALYDGDDSIYIVGGYANLERSNQILRYRVSSETIQVIGSMPGRSYTFGSLLKDLQGNILYFGGDDYRSVVKFDPVANTTETIATAPYDLDWSCCVMGEDSSTVYIFGGTGDITGILKFDISTSTFTTAGNLPRIIWDTTCAKFEGNVYIFGEVDAHEIGFDLPELVFEINLKTMETTMSTTTFPEINGHCEAIVIHDTAYFIGGYPSQDQFPSNGLIQFNPEADMITLIPVEDFSFGADIYFYYAPSAAYVEKLNRIYFFGGLSGNNSFGPDFTDHDEIWFIDLNPTPSPTTTTDTPITSTPPSEFVSCIGLPDGVYAHPSDCSLFVGCRNEVAEVHSCPQPLLFDPVMRNCNLPHLAVCQLSCETREDGVYPHHSDCSSFVVCYEGQLNIHQCPQPLLFDPVGNRCDFVECQTSAN